MNRTGSFGSTFTPKNVATLGVLVASIFVLQMGFGSIVIGGTSFSLVLIPIVLGSLLIGPWAGAVLGFVFSFIVYLYGVVGMDPFTHLMIETNWFVTCIVCFSKGVLAGLVPGLIYKALKQKKQFLGVILASLSAPIVNTGLFVSEMLIFRGVFVDAFVSNSYFENASAYVYFIIIICAGVNFLVEFGINAVLTPAVHTIVKVVERKVTEKSSVEKQSADTSAVPSADVTANAGEAAEEKEHRCEYCGCLYKGYTCPNCGSKKK